MNTKEELHRIIDTLDEQKASSLLRFLKTTNNVTFAELKSDMDNMGQQTEDTYYFDNNIELELLKPMSITKKMASEIVQFHSIGKEEIRTLVTLFYQLQDLRKAAREQIRSIEYGNAKKLLDMIIPDAENVLQEVTQQDVDLVAQYCAVDPKFISDFLDKDVEARRKKASGKDATWDYNGLYKAVADIPHKYKRTEEEENIWNSKKPTEQIETNVVALDSLLAGFVILESGVKRILTTVVESRPEGRWLLEIHGIGEVLAAGLMAYINIEKCAYATNLISYAGLNDNNRPWLGREKAGKIVDQVIGDSKKITDDHIQEICRITKWKPSFLAKYAYDDKKGKWSKDKLKKACARMPYNKDFKVLMWKVTHSFEYVKTSGKSQYGDLLVERINYETEKNERGEYADRAKEELEKKNWDKSTESYKTYIQGKLPKAHINARAKRWVGKIFLSHVFEEFYRVYYDTVPPRYYTLEHLPGHHKDIKPWVDYSPVSSEISSTFIPGGFGQGWRPDNEPSEYERNMEILKDKDLELSIDQEEEMKIFFGN